MVRSCAVDRRRLVWVTVFVTALTAVIAVAWTLAVPSGNTAASPRGGAPEADADGETSDGSAPAGPSLTADTADDSDDESTTTYDSYTTLARTPDTGDEAPVPLAATSSRPSTTVTSRPTTSPTPTPPTTLDSCIDPATGNTARCVTTTAPGPGATPPGPCDGGVGRTTVPGCTGGTGGVTTTSVQIDPCAIMTTFGCPGSITTAAPTVPPTFPTTSPPMTCYPVACPVTTRGAP